MNWAQLAQKWMQMRDAGKVPSVASDDSIPPLPNKEPPSHPPPAPDGLPVNGSFLPPGGYLPTIPVGTFSNYLVCICKVKDFNETICIYMILPGYRCC